MELELRQLKKSMSLTKFEFKLFKQLIQLEQTLVFRNNKILLNLQISGGKDSMCLLRAFVTLLNSKICKLKNVYIPIVQHFNHKQRGSESDEDAFFVAQECIKMGIPVYLYSLAENRVENNFQNYFRNWRKKNGRDLSIKLMQKLNCDKYFIVTAHHARDHVETVLLHLLRGSGINGLKGISLFDENKIYFRPFFNILYKEIIEYVLEKNIQFREDSSNSEDKYKRNYIRKNILPHFEHLQKNYENSFVKLSQHVSFGNIKEVIKQDSANEDPEKIYISHTTTLSEIFYKFKAKINIQNISENCLKNVLYEAHLLLSKKEDKITKKIALKFDQSLLLIKKGQFVEVIF